MLLHDSGLIPGSLLTSHAPTNLVDAPSYHGVYFDVMAYVLKSCFINALLEKHRTLRDNRAEGNWSRYLVN